MWRLSVIAGIAALLAGCSTIQRSTSRPPLEGEGEVYLYAMPFPREADGVTFSVESFSAEPESGMERTLEVRTRTVTGKDLRSQKLIAWGRLAPGSYRGFRLRVTAARLATDEGTHDLLVPPESVSIRMPFTIQRQSARVVWLTYEPQESIQQGFKFSPAFTALTPGRTAPQRSGYVSNADDDNLTVFESANYLVTGIIPTGRTPRGIALEPIANRAFVALSGEDQIAVIDMSAVADERRRIRLLVGDEPRDLVLTPDRSTLLALNFRSRTLAFIDPIALVEIRRVNVGDDPGRLLLDRSGRRAYVFNRKTNSISVIDVANRSVVATVTTDAEPIFGQFSLDGSRLYVIFGGSGFMSVFSAPGMGLLKKVFVGLGASAIRVDPRTDMVYVAQAADRRVSVFDTLSPMPVDDFAVEGAVSWMAIDDLPNSIITLTPAGGKASVFDLTSRTLRAVMEVGANPFTVKVAGER
jgi:YVTN family beta-propeller protein